MAPMSSPVRWVAPVAAARNRGDTTHRCRRSLLMAVMVWTCLEFLRPVDKINWSFASVSGSVSGGGGGYYVPVPVRRDGDALKAVRRKIDWYNLEGNLAKPICYKGVKSVLEAMEPQQAMKILRVFKTKGSKDSDPTEWIKKAARKHIPNLHQKVRSRIHYLNSGGNLAANISYGSVKGSLSSIPSCTALSILKEVSEKARAIRDPTAWIIRAADKQAQRAADRLQAAGDLQWAPDPIGEAMAAQSLDAELVKAMQWYNTNGGLLQPLDFKALAPLLSQLPAKDALLVVKQLDGMGPWIGNPTGWISKAVKRMLSQGAVATS